MSSKKEYKIGDYVSVEKNGYKDNFEIIGKEINGHLLRNSDIELYICLVPSLKISKMNEEPKIITEQTCFQYTIDRSYIGQKYHEFFRKRITGFAVKRNYCDSCVERRIVDSWKWRYN